MAYSEHKNENGILTHKKKIYVWVFTSLDSKLTVKNGGEDIFSYKPYLQNRQRINNEFVINAIENWLKYKTPTPEINKYEAQDGIDKVHPD